MKPLRTLANHKGAKKYKTLLDNILVCCWRKTLTTSYGENLPLPSEFQINKLLSVFLFLALVFIRLGTFSLENLFGSFAVIAAGTCCVQNK